MPKETIHTPHPGEIGVDPPFVLDVLWNKDMDVNVGIRIPEDVSILQRLYGNPEMAEIIGRFFRKNPDYLARIQAEIGVDFRDGDSEAKAMRSVGYALVEVIEQATVAANGMNSDSLWWNPGRHQINMLIRLLRRARDQAYGKDE